jgi:hypothetical protein
MPMGRLDRTQPVYMASGEATEQAQLPEKFKATPQPNSPLTAQLTVPPEWLPDIARSPVVTRVPRMRGIWHLYARGAQRQPVERLGATAIPRPNISTFNTSDMGPIRDAGFNDALFQAGYPGFNLGLSFKVPTLPTQGGPRTNMSRGGPGNNRPSTAVVRVSRPSGAPRVR